MGGWCRWALVSLDGVVAVAPSRMVSVSASVNLPLHHKVQKFSSGTGSPGWSRKKGRKTVVVWRWISRTLLVGVRQNLAALGGWPIETYSPNFVNFGPGVPQYHAATCISASLMHWFMDAVCNRAGHNIFSSCGFFFLFSPPNLSGRRLDVYHTSTHGVALV